MTRPALVALVVCVTCAPTRAQVPHHFHEWDDIGYHAKIHQLCQTHIKNHRVRCTNTVWEPGKRDYKEGESWASEWDELYGDAVWISEARHPPKGSTRRAARYFTPDGYYNLGSDGTRPFDLGAFNPEWKDHSSGYSGTFSSFLATRQIYKPDRGERLIAHGPDTFENRPAIRLHTRKSDSITSTIYLDRDTFQLLSVATEVPAEYALRGLPDPEKSNIRVTYRDAGAKRYPVRFEHTRSRPNGATRKYMQTDFAEYAPHTPTADELDMEKRFGMKPTPHEPRPPFFPTTPPPRFPPPEPPPAGDSRIIDAPPVDHTPRYVIVAVVAVALVVVLLFPFRNRPKPPAEAGL